MTKHDKIVAKSLFIHPDLSTNHQNVITTIELYSIRIIIIENQIIIKNFVATKRNICRKRSTSPWKTFLLMIIFIILLILVTTTRSLVTSVDLDHKSSTDPFCCCCYLLFQLFPSFDTSFELRYIWCYIERFIRGTYSCGCFPFFCNTRKTIEKWDIKKCFIIVCCSYYYFNLLSFIYGWKNVVFFLATPAFC